MSDTMAKLQAIRAAAFTMTEVEAKAILDGTEVVDEGLITAAKIRMARPSQDEANAAVQAGIANAEAKKKAARDVWGRPSDAFVDQLAVRLYGAWSSGETDWEDLKPAVQGAWRAVAREAIHAVALHVLEIA